jgi:hypothetical protein
MVKGHEVVSAEREGRGIVVGTEKEAEKVGGGEVGEGKWGL